MRGAMKSFRKKTFKPQNFNAGSENTSLSFDLHVQRDNVKTGSVDIGESTTHNRNRFFRDFLKFSCVFAIRSRLFTTEPIPLITATSHAHLALQNT